MVISLKNKHGYQKIAIFEARDACSKSLCLVSMIYVKFWGVSLSGWWFQIFFYFHLYLGKWSNLTILICFKWVETTNKLFFMISITKAALPGDQEVEQMGHVFPAIRTFFPEVSTTEGGRLSPTSGIFDEIMSHPRSMKIWCLPLSFRIRMFGDLNILNRIRDCFKAIILSHWWHLKVFQWMWPGCHVL